MDDFRGYAFELQATAEKYFKAERVEEYMVTVFARAGHDGVIGVVSYIIIVIAKYVQIMAAYHISKEDSEGLRLTYEGVNDNFHAYSKSFRKVTGRVLNLDQTSVETYKEIQKKLDQEEKAASRDSNNW